MPTNTSTLMPTMIWVDRESGKSLLGFRPALNSALPDPRWIHAATVGA